jgi:hypothetical protein
MGTPTISVRRLLDQALGLHGGGVLDQKLRMTAKALRSWRATRVGAIRLQLAAARTIIYEFDMAQPRSSNFRVK